MKQINGERRTSRQGSLGSGEYGGSRLKFLIVVVILGVVGYASYLYIPVRYDAYLFQDLMQHDVDVASASGKTTAWVTEQLTKSAKDYNVPADAVITSGQEENRVVSTVRFTRPIPFFGYTFHYEFDYTARSTTFLLK
jgi:hypothetical protein